MDSFFGIGIGELFFIAIIALIVLGPERLPGAIREVAKWSRMIRNLSSELTSQFSEEMKAFEEINPNKILRDLTDDPADQAKKTQTGKTAATAKSAAKPAAKPAAPSTTTKTTPAKPVTSASSASTATEAKTPPKVPTPPMPKKRTPTTSGTEKAEADAGTPPEDAVKADAVKPDEKGATAQGEPENRILPPASGTADAQTSAAEPSARDGVPQPTPATHSADRDQTGDEKQESKLAVDASASHPALAVNGNSAAEGES